MFCSIFLLLLIVAKFFIWLTTNEQVIYIYTYTTCTEKKDQFRWQWHAQEREVMAQTYFKNMVHLNNKIREKKTQHSENEKCQERFRRKNNMLKTFSMMMKSVAFFTLSRSGRIHMGHIFHNYEFKCVYEFEACMCLIDGNAP